MSAPIMPSPPSTPPGGGIPLPSFSEELRKFRELLLVFPGENEAEQFWEWTDRTLSGLRGGADELALEFSHLVVEEASRFQGVQQLTILLMGTYALRGSPDRSEDLSTEIENRLEIVGDFADMRQWPRSLKSVLCDLLFTSEAKPAVPFLRHVLDADVAQEHQEGTTDYLAEQTVEFKRELLEQLSVETLNQIFKYDHELWGLLSEAKQNAFFHFLQNNFAVTQCTRQFLQTLVNWKQEAADHVLTSVLWWSSGGGIRWSIATLAYPHASPEARGVLRAMIDMENMYGSLGYPFVQLVIEHDPEGVDFFFENIHRLNPWNVVNRLLNQIGRSEEMAAHLPRALRWLEENFATLPVERASRFLRNLEQFDLAAAADRDDVSARRLLAICSSHAPLLGRLTAVQRDALLQELEASEGQVTMSGHLAWGFLQAELVREPEPDITRNLLALDLAGTDSSHVGPDSNNSDMGTARILRIVSRLAPEDLLTLVDLLLAALPNPQEGAGGVGVNNHVPLDDRLLATFLFEVAESERTTFDALLDGLERKGRLQGVLTHLPASQELRKKIRAYQKNLDLACQSVMACSTKVQQVEPLDADAAAHLTALTEEAKELYASLIELGGDRRSIFRLIELIERMPGRYALHELLVNEFKAWQAAARRTTAFRVRALFPRDMPSKHGAEPSVHLRDLREMCDNELEPMLDILDGCLESEPGSVGRGSATEGYLYTEELLDFLLKGSGEEIQELRSEAVDLARFDQESELSILLREVSYADSNRIENHDQPSLMGIAQLIKAKRAQLPEREDPLNRMLFGPFLGEIGAGGVCGLPLTGGTRTISRILGCSYQEVTQRGFGFCSTAGSLRLLGVEPRAQADLVIAKRMLLVREGRQVDGSQLADMKGLVDRIPKDGIWASLTAQIAPYMELDVWTPAQVVELFAYLDQADRLHHYFVQPGIEAFWEGMPPEIDDLTVLIEAVGDMDFVPEDFLNLSGEKMRAVKRALTE